MGAAGGRDGRGNREGMRRGTNLPLMGEYNQAVVLEAIRLAPRGLSRAALARTTGLSAQTVTNVTRRLLEAGLVRAGDVSGSGPGRPGRLLVLDAGSRLTVGVHLDPASVSLVMLDLAGDTVARSQVVPPRTESPQAVLDEVVRAVDDLITTSAVARERVVGVGIAVPGPVDTRRGTVIDPPHLRDWHDVPVREAIAHGTGLPAALDKDVVAAAGAHLWFGQVERLDTAVFVYLGTGVAMAPIVNGELVRGASGNAGEAHHLIVDPRGPWCDCGRRGCFGAALSANGLAAQAAARGVRVEAGSGSGIVDAVTADRAIADLARLAAGGDKVVLELLEEAGTRLARAIETVADLLDLETAVVGGATWTRLEPWLSGPVHAALAQGRQQRLVVQGSSFGADVVAVGAASLMLDEAFTPRPADLLLQGEGSAAGEGSGQDDVAGNP